MVLKLEHTTFNSADAPALARWWADLFGVEAEDPYGGFFLKVHLPGGAILAFQQVADPTPGRRRLHLDFTTDDLDAEVARLEQAGATAIERNGDPGGGRWVVLTDPDGNEFCVAAES